MNKMITGIGILFIAIGIIAVFSLSTMGYQECLDVIINLINVPESKKDKLATYITSSNFRFIQGIPLLISLLGILIMIYSKAVLNTGKEISNLANRIKEFFTTLPKFEKYLALTIIIGYALYNISHAIRMPVHYDEAYTYFNFTKRSIFASISYYPVPNNHIFHSVLTNLTYNFPFSELINLRIPTLVVSFLVTIGLFYTFSKLLNKRIALLLLPLFCLLFPSICYAYLSRGYMLVLLTFIVCFYATLRLTHLKEENQSDTRYYTYFTIASIVGFYTIPSFLYPFFTCISYSFLYFIINKLYSNAIRLILFCALTTMVVLLLYTPIFIVSGLDAVAGNRFVTPVSREVILGKLLPHFDHTSRFLFELPMVIFLSLLMVSTILLVKKKQYTILFCGYCFLLMPVFVFIHSVRPFPRTWIYTIIPCLYVVGLVIKSFELDKRMNHWHILIIQAVITCSLIFSFYSRMARSHDFSFDAIELADYLVENKAQKVYVNHPLVSTNLLFIFEERDLDLEVLYAPRLLDEGELNTIKSCCKYVVSGNSLESLQGFKMIKNWNGYIYLNELE